MYKKIDLHTHTTFSPDARSTMHEMCRAAVRNDLEAIAFTEHKEWAGAFRAPFDGVDDYFTQIERCRRDFANPTGRPLIVLSGVEMGQPHEHEAQAVRFLERHPFDVTIASIHYLHGQNIHDTACFRGHDIHRVLSDYFRSVDSLVLNFDFDILAHFDRILWRPSLISAEFDIFRVENEVRRMFESAIERHVMLELNTKVFRTRPSWHAALATMLVWYREAGGEEILINSDAHRTVELQGQFDEAAHLLSSAGLAQSSGTPLLQRALA